MVLYNSKKYMNPARIFGNLFQKNGELPYLVALKVLMKHIKIIWRYCVLL